MRASVFVIALLAVAAPAVAGDAVPYSAVLVNGQRIPAERIRTDMEARKHANAALHGGAQREPGKVMVDVVVDQLVVRELLIQEARARGFSITDAERAAAWEGESKRWGSPERLAKSLEVRKLTEGFLKERIAEDLLIGKLVSAAVDAKAQPSERDERAYYEKNAAAFPKDVPPQLRLARIGYAKHGGPDGAKARYKEFWSRFERGESFAALAREFSDHPSAAEGGAVGEKQDPPLPFFESGLSLRPAQFSDPHSDDQALYLYFRERLPLPMSFKEAQPQVRKKLTEEMKSELFAALLRDLKSRARIEYLP